MGFNNKWMMDFMHILPNKWVFLYLNAVWMKIKTRCQQMLFRAWPLGGLLHLTFPSRLPKHLVKVYVLCKIHSWEECSRTLLEKRGSSVMTVIQKPLFLWVYCVAHYKPQKLFKWGLAHRQCATGEDCIIAYCCHLPSKLFLCAIWFFSKKALQMIT